MQKLVLFLTAIALFSCNAGNQHPKNTAAPDTISSASAYTNYVRFKDKQLIEHVIYSFCEHFDNGKLDKCLEFMDDSIEGNIDNIRLKGKENWKAKINTLLESTKNSHYQPRHMLTNLQVKPGNNDTINVSMYGSCLWTDLETGQIQLMSVGSYKGSLVYKEGQWLITRLYTLPDSRLVKYFYKDAAMDSTISL
ncbi:SnoaL-like domain-containing protein [Chitinophaga terrae (ex Kim and Jung 2007)]|uniref:SnoaL-like domain-containing protein n=1 Tax=Chitinophaga terrae (ex Kim and Jung 2007) TaxID=408074 RepID=A0A1H3ZBN1_9BACT|nr:nuclear transport factor 2 family protein [Chitinophaga terrae (ex Kim and Jung 2007)]GEP88665.1 hypothetical protein CTE07_03100 [Chitinophaga terrae (ex Kim and Jung 2007)]SEA21025.1 SnoaL-like domain-containing protein [Chitinophaga terrae (ex Kim and Jung 2007)]